MFFASQAISILAFFLLLFVILFEIFMPYVVDFLAPGFVDDAGKMALATSLCRVTFPFLWLVSIVSFQAVLKVFPHIVLNVIPSRVFVVIVYILLDDICPICVIGIFRKFHYKNSSIIYLAAE